MGGRGAYIGGEGLISGGGGGLISGSLRYYIYKTLVLLKQAAKHSTTTRKIVATQSYTEGHVAIFFFTFIRGVQKISLLKMKQIEKNTRKIKSVIVYM